VQLDVANYDTTSSVNNLSPANRADLLVKAPTQTGNYSLCIVRNSGMPVQAGAPGQPEAPSVLLTVNVTGAALNMSFIPAARFPTMPSFLRDIPDTAIVARRSLVFGAGFSTINGASFQDSLVNQTMQLNTTEEWTISNQANDKAHPFHIHINPFQITQIFEPNSVEATTPGNPCYVDPNNPATWIPCPTRQPTAPFVWWDTFGIPTGQQIKQSCTTLSACPPQLQPYITCGNGVCTLFIAGWFKMRTRFVDWTGQYVLHCHILIHEDRGMMQLIQVVPDKSGYGHH
jgi:FtsP/CotA-like multicopper oxidase with cupredoxin domain